MGDVSGLRLTYQHTRDVEMTYIANATSEPDEHGENEITPEMITAGVDAYFDHEWHHGEEELVVEKIYKAMHRAQKGIKCVGSDASSR